MSKELTLEQATEELSALIKKLEDKNLSLDESIKVYKEAGDMLVYCYKQLDDCKGKITDINAKIESLKSTEDLH